MKSAILFLFVALALAGSSDGGVVVIGKLARENVVAPGETFEGIIFLENTDADPASVRVFQTDYLFYADGTNIYGQSGEAPRSNADWITITPTRLRIGPGETASVRYKGTVPVELEATGTFWSMIMVEPSSLAAVSLDGESEDGAVGVQTKIRFGIQIVTEVGQAASTSLKVLDKRLVQSGDERVLELDVENDGDRLLAPAMTVELFDSNGTSVGFFEAGASRIYPDCSVRKKVNLSDVPPGKYAAMVLLDSGDLQVMGARYDLELSP